MQTSGIGPCDHSPGLAKTGIKVTIIPKKSTAETTPFAHLNFLVIDDNPVMRKLLHHTVTSAGGHKIQIARDFNEALSHLKGNTPFDVILCDYNLNDLRDGQQLLEEARRGRLLPATSVWIMVTGESEYQQIFSAAELLPDDYLLKPFKVELLQTRISKALHRAKALSRANAHLYAGEYAECINACQQALAQEAPKYPVDFQRMAGEAMLRAGRGKQAHDFFCGLLSAGKTYPWIRLGLARAYFQINESDLSHDLLESLILEAPGYLQAHDWLARIQEERGRPEVAKEILSETLKKNPKALSRHREIVRVAMAANDPTTAINAYGALHLHGRGSSFLTPGDFSGYATLLLNTTGKQAAPKLRLLEQNLRDFFAKDERFALARTTIDYFYADCQGNTHRRDAAYQAMKTMAGKAKENTEKIALLKAAINNDDKDFVQALARELFLSADGNPAALKQIIDLFPEAAQNEVRQMQETVSGELKQLAANAVKMARAGDLDGAVAEFDRIAQDCPSAPILYNAGVAVAKWIESHHWDPQKGRQLDSYIQGLQAIDPSSPALKRLKEFRASMPLH